MDKEIVVIIVLCLIIVGFVVYLITNGKGKTCPKSDNKYADTALIGNRVASNSTSAVWFGINGSGGVDPTKYKALKQQIDSYKPQTVDEKYIKMCCQLALISILDGNFGVGVVVIDTQGLVGPMLPKSYRDALAKAGFPPEVVAIGRNQLVKPYFRSDRHAEMVALDALEEALSQNSQFQKQLPPGLILYTQLESCSMCLSRIGTSAIPKVLYGAPDNCGGMVHLLCQLPPAFIYLLKRQLHTPADISADLINLCLDCFTLTAADVGKSVNQRTPEGTPDYPYCLPEYDSDVRQRGTYDTYGYFYAPP